MKLFLTIICLSCLPVFATAQTAQEAEDKGYLTRLIEDNLSGAGRTVDIRGFQGALSTQASLEVLSIADDAGIWLTLENVTLNWNRGALLRGRIEIAELSASQFTLARLPQSQTSTPSPEATAFALPELPVSIALDALQIDRITLGDTILGEPFNASLSGAARLDGGEGAMKIIATRLDKNSGLFDVDVSYANETTVLALDLTVAEDADGIIARKLDLPDHPSVSLQAKGTAPIDNYAAKITLNTDGKDRITGNIRLTTQENGTRGFDAALNGDVAPLLAPDYQAFFGDALTLRVAGQSLNDGRINLDQFDLAGQSIALEGSAQINADGWPQFFDIKGEIAAQDGGPILLPVSGPQLMINTATLDIGYDAALSDLWRADIQVTDVTRPGLTIAELALEGGGVISPQPDEAASTTELALNGGGIIVPRPDGPEFTADLDYMISGLVLDDPGAADALGDSFAGEFVAQKNKNAPLVIDHLTLNGLGLMAHAKGVVYGSDQRYRTSAEVGLDAQALNRFSALVGQTLSGSGTLALLADITPLDGLYDLTLSGDTVDLAIGMPQIDPLLIGQSNITLVAVRDAAGTRLDTLTLNTPEARITANATLTSGASNATAAVALNDVNLVMPELNGAARFDGQFTRDMAGITDFMVTGDIASAAFDATGQAHPAGGGQTINAVINSEIADLSQFSTLAGRDLAGQIATTLNATALSDGQRFTATLNAQTQDIKLGLPELDPLLAGQGEVVLRASMPRVGSYRITDLQLRTPMTKLIAQGVYTPAASSDGAFDLRITDASGVIDGLSGPVHIAGSALQLPSGDAHLKITGDGPGTDLSLNVQQMAITDAITANLSARIADLGVYRGLIGQPVSGALRIQATGQGASDLSALQAEIDATSDDLALGAPLVDRLLQGAGALKASVTRGPEGSITIDGFSAKTAALSLLADLQGSEAGAGNGSFEARLSDIGLITDQLSGPVTASGTAARLPDGYWDIAVNGAGPSNMMLDLAGQILDADNLVLAATGTLPMGVVNRALDPQRLDGDARFDLSLNGAPSLSNISGDVSINGARLTAPALSMALAETRGGVRFDNGQAVVDMTAQVEPAGGQITIRGPVSLEGQMNADLAATLRAITLRDAALYETRVDGGLAVQGPLRGGAKISGTLNLGPTEIQVPSSGVSTLGTLPEVTHIGAPYAVRQTLARAGIGTKASSPGTSNSNAIAFPLDVRINAPARVFIRGRGLDAELGGQLTLGGTTQEIIPTGQFDLIRGRLDILQQRFELSEGRAVLQGAFAPYIYLVAKTKARTGTEISIIVEGPAETPEVRFASVPDLPQDEVLAQLIFGRNLSEISPLQAVQLASAVATLAGRGGTGLMDTLRQDIGLDDLDLITDEDGNAALRAGAYLSENIYTDVVINADGETEINLNLDITSDVTAKGAVGSNGETSIGIFFERDY